MDLEIVNKLFLELSQFTTAKTARELELEDALREMLKQDEGRTHVHSCDMGGLHGLSVRVQQGEKGRPWHDSRAKARAILEKA